jgi:hypothetical protein
MLKLLSSRRTIISLVGMTYLLILGLVMKADVINGIVMIAGSVALGNAAEGALSSRKDNQSP